MKPTRKVTRRRRNIKVPTDCPFCKKKEVLDYKEVEVLKKYIADRGKILGKKKTGICAKHQRKLAKQIKHARHLAYLPFVNIG